MNKKFILCVGVPKAGTTWLFRCLQAHTSVNLGHKKEYHVFDTHFYPELNSYRVKILEKKEDSSSFYKKYATEKNFDKKLQDDHDFYGAYFAKILQNPDIFIIGDFTPTYCVLREDGFEYIKLLANRYGLDTHIIYLVRDPVERILSFAKMAFKFREHHGIPLAPDLSLNEFLASICFSQLNYDVTDYQETITSLVNCFDESKLYFGVYETMHTHRELGRLSDFLGIAIDPAWSEKRINANAPSNSEFDAVLVRKLKLAFNDQFLFCQQFFKDQNLSLVWKNYS